MSRDTETGGEAAVAAEGAEPFWLLLYWLCVALVGRVRANMPMRVVTGGITACGLVLLCMPLALWMAWSKLVLGIFLLLGAVAGAVIVLLVWLSPEDRI